MSDSHDRVDTINQSSSVNYLNRGPIQIEQVNEVPKIPDYVPSSVNSNDVHVERIEGKKEQDQPFKCPVIIDFVADQNKSRYIAAFLVLWCYIIVVFSIITQNPAVNLKITDIKIEISLPQNITIGKYLNETTLVPRVKLVSNDIKLTQNIQVYIQVVDMLTQSSPIGDLCNLQVRKKQAGTLESLRVQEICKPELQGSTALTDETGRAVFDQFKIVRGPQGRYGFIFYILNSESVSEQLHSSVIYSYIYSEVGLIKFYQNLYPDDFQVGQPFALQPEFVIVDFNGKILPGKKLVAFSWPEAYTNVALYGVQYLNDANRFGILTNAVSQFSDQSGIAKFTNLTVSSMQYGAIYIMVTCDFVVFTFWQLTRSGIYEQFHIPYGRNPLILKNSIVKEILIDENYSRTVKQGQPFSSPIQVIIKDELGTPIKGLIGTAVIYGRDGLDYFNGYNSLMYGEAIGKRLIKPVAGIFKKEYQNPVDLDPIVNVTRSNEMGEIQFTDMFFSIYGMAQTTYQIVVFVDGYRVSTEYIKVQTSVAKLQFLSEFPSLILLDTTNINSIKPLLKISDENRVGIRGKVPYMKILDASKSGSETVLFHDQIILQLDYSLLEFSDEDGLFEINLIFNFLRQNSVYVILQFEVEGIFIRTEPISIVQNLKSNLKVGTIKFQSDIPNDGVYVNQVPLKQEFDLKFTVYNERNEPMPNVAVLIIFFLSPDTLTLPSVTFIPRFDQGNSVSVYDGLGAVKLTDANGIAIFKKISFISGQQYLYQVIYSAISGWESVFPPSKYSLKRRRNLEEQEEFLKRNIVFLEEFLRSKFPQNPIINGAQIQRQNEKSEPQQWVLFQQIMQSKQRRSLQSSEFDGLSSDGLSILEDNVQEIFQETESILLGMPTPKETQIVSGIPLNLFLLTRISSIYLDNSLTDVLPMFVRTSGNQIPPLEYINPDNQESAYFFYVLVIGVDGKPFQNQDVELQIRLNHFPGVFNPQYMWELQKEKFYVNFINFWSSPKTDDRGYVKYRIGVLKGYFGYVAYIVGTDGIYINNEFFSQYPKVEKLQILSQPQPNSPSTAYQAGNFIPGTFQVQAVDKNGKGLQGYAIIFALVKSSQNFDKSWNDPSDLWGDEKSAIIGLWRKAQTDANGVAKFNTVTLFDVQTSICVKFQFLIVDLGLIYIDTDQQANQCDPDSPGICIMSQTTNQYCFKSFFSVHILNSDLYSQIINFETLFLSPIIITLIKKNLSDIDKKYLRVTTATLIQVDDLNNLSYPLQLTLGMMGGTICAYQQIGLTNTIGRCEINEYELNGLNFMQVQFNNLVWKSRSDSVIKLSMSSPLNYKRSQDNILDLSSLPISRPDLVLEVVKEEYEKIKAGETQDDIAKLAKAFSIVQLGEEAQALYNEVSSLRNSSQLFSEETLTKLKQKTPILIDKTQSFYTELSELVNSNPRSDETQPIFASSAPKLIQISQQPPQSINVQDIAIIQVSCIGASLTPIKELTVTLAIFPIENLIDYNDPAKSLNKLAQGDVSLNGLINQFRSENEILIEERRKYSKTNDFGIARFNLQVFKMIKF